MRPVQDWQITSPESSDTCTGEFFLSISLRFCALPVFELVFVLLVLTIIWLASKVHSRPTKVEFPAVRILQLPGGARITVPDYGAK